MQRLVNTDPNSVWEQKAPEGLAVCSACAAGKNLDFLSEVV